MSHSASRAALAATVSTHVLDTSLGRPARDIAVRLAARPTPDGGWTPHAAGRTDADGRCTTLPALPEGTAQARLTFEVGPHLARGGAGAAFLPEVTVAFTVTPGEHFHVPLLLTPFGYTVYRGS